VRSEAVVRTPPFPKPCAPFATLQFDERPAKFVPWRPKFGRLGSRSSMSTRPATVATVGEKLFRRLQPRAERPAAAMAAVAGRSADATDKLRYHRLSRSSTRKVAPGGNPPSRTVHHLFRPVGRNGNVDKIAIEGMRFQPGETLFFRIVDTSVECGWLAEVYGAGPRLCGRWADTVKVTSQ